MGQKRHTPEQIVDVLRQAESGTPVDGIYRKSEASEAIFFRWKKQLGSLGVL
jgi:putative transposase